MPVTISVTGCSTWMRVFTSMKKKLPFSSIRNSKVPAFVYCTARAASATTRAHLAAHLVGDRDRRRLLEQLLVASLDRALALAEMNDVAVVIAEDLELDVARRVEIFLDVDVAQHRTPPRPRAARS